MNLEELKKEVDSIIKNLKDYGTFPKENNIIDFKFKLNVSSDDNAIENFLMNFGKDILSFTNSDGGIIIIGVKEKEDASGAYDDIGLDKESLDILSKVDINFVTQKFEAITKVGVSVDLQEFNIGTKKFYYLLIEKSTTILVPIKTIHKYKIKEGEIVYRSSSKNEVANRSTSEFNRFIQVKANEKSKEFMEIWSNLLPEMIDINPREVLIINPVQEKVYGFNSKDNSLSGSDIEIEKGENGIFNVILNAISAGNIGKITTNEGKPIYKIVGKKVKKGTMFINLKKQIKVKSKYRYSDNDLKKILYYLKWTNVSKINLQDPVYEELNCEFEHFIWIETIDDNSNRNKVYFSLNASTEIVKIINNDSLHLSIFGKELSKNK